MNPLVLHGFQRESAHGDPLAGAALANGRCEGKCVSGLGSDLSETKPGLQYRYPSPSMRPDPPQIRPRSIVRPAAPARTRGRGQHGIRVAEILKSEMTDPARAASLAGPDSKRGGKTPRDLPKGLRCSRKS